MFKLKTKKSQPKKDVIAIANRIIKRGYTAEITEQIERFLRLFKKQNLFDKRIEEIKRLLEAIELDCIAGNYNTAYIKCVTRLNPTYGGLPWVARVNAAKKLFAVKQDKDGNKSARFHTGGVVSKGGGRSPSKKRTAAGRGVRDYANDGADGFSLDKVNFSAVAPKAFDGGGYSPVNVIMYEEAYRGVVDKIIAQSDAPVNEVSSGIHEVKKGSEITVALTSPSAEVEIDESSIKQIWNGKYLNFIFMVCVPENYGGKQILFTATIYIDAVIATKLKFTARCAAESKQKLELVRSDIKSAFMSYSSEDRKRVAGILQGIHTARPDLDVFFDVDSLRQGEDWEERLYREVDSRDVLYLCWSRSAGASVWVDREWRRAYEKGGEEKIEPIPIEPPEACPPPEELNDKHFNDKMIYYAYELNLNQ